MTLSDALKNNVRDMRQRDIDESRRAIGDAKHVIRESGRLRRRWDGELPQYDGQTVRRLRPLAARLDMINLEDERRQQMPAREVAALEAKLRQSKP